MAVERADLSGSLNLEQTLPVASAPAAQGQAASEGGQGKPRRLPAEEVDAEPAGEDLDQKESDQPPHRIDSLA
ncbi:MAG: hypothetical protein WAM78_03275 [Candidatus Sulfotelmatobacter sp.]